MYADQKYDELVQQIAELKKKQELCSVILEGSPDWEYFRDSSGNILYISKGFERITGYSREDYVSGKVTEQSIIYPDYYQKVINVTKKAKDSGSVINLSIKIIRKDKSIINVLFNAHAFYANNEFIGVKFCIREMSDTNQTEEILSNLIENCQLAIHMVDTEGYTLKTNIAHTELLGLEPPKEYSIFNDTQAKAHGFSHLFNVLKQGKIVSFPEIKYNPHNVSPIYPNKTTYLKTIGIPILNIEHKPVKYIFIHEDVSDIDSHRNNLFSPETILTQQNKEFLLLNSQLLQANNELLESKKQLEQSELLIRAISDNIPNGIVYQLNTGKKLEKQQFVFISEGVERMHGFTASEIMKDSTILFNQIVEEDRQEIFEKKQLALKSFCVFKAEARFKTPNGKTEWRLITSAPRQLENGEIIWDGVVIDINERKLSELALLESEEKFRTMVENISEVIWQTDEKLVFTYVSPFDEQMRGYSSHEIIGTPVWQYMKPSVARTIKHNLKVGMAKEKSGERISTQLYDFEYECKDGSWIWVEITVMPSRNDNGIIEGFQGITRNITDRKIAEKKQRQSDEKLQLSLEATNASLFEIDVTTSKVTIIPYLFEHLGYLKEEIPETHQSFLSFVFTDDIPGIIHTMRNHFENKTGDFYLQFRMKSKKGSLVWVEVNGKVVQWSPHKRPISIVGIAREINSQKQAEIELQLSQQQMQYYIRNSPVIIFALDKQGIFTFSDGNALDKLGLKPGQVVGTSALELYSKYPRIIENIKAALNGKALSAMHDIGLTAFDTRYSPIFDQMGNVDGIIGVATDVSDRRIAENKMRIFGMALEQSPSVVMITNADGRIEFVNQKFVDFMQYQLEEVYGRYPRIFNEGHMPDTNFALMWDTLKAGNVWYGECQNRKKDETYFWESVIISPITENDGKIANYIIISQDITDRKRMIKELVDAKEKAEESDRLKTAFLLNISHEIRTPMNAIIGFSDLLRDSQIEDEKQLGYISIIQKSSQQLLSIVTDIIRISTLETNQEKVIIQEACVNDIIYELYLIFNVQSSLQNISFYYSQQFTDSRSVINCDKEKIMQVLKNLIGNAIRFTHEGFVEFGYELVNSDVDEDKYLEFFVKDSGIGIDKELHKKIFERFRQADESISRRYGGAGLGLSISKALVELMGGKISVDSELEHGSTFRFTIPYKPVFVEQNINSKIEQNQRKALVLISEDEDFNYLVAEEIFNRMNINTLRSKNGADAVEKCKANPNINLVLMDISMPEMNGYETTKMIKEFRPNLPIIALSTHIFENKLKNHADFGFDGHANKPLNKQKIEELLAKNNILNHNI